MVSASSCTDFIQRWRCSVIRSAVLCLRGTIEGRLTDGMASSEVTGMALDKPSPLVTGDVTGGLLALGATEFTEPRDMAAMVSVNVLLE